MDEVSAEERQLVEDRFMSDSDYFETVELVEEQMILEYLRGELPAQWRAGFSSAILDSPARERRVAEMRTFLSSLESSPEKRPPRIAAQLAQLVESPATSHGRLGGCGRNCGRLCPVATAPPLALAGRHACHADRDSTAGSRVQLPEQSRDWLGCYLSSSLSSWLSSAPGRYNPPRAVLGSPARLPRADC